MPKLKILKPKKESSPEVEEVVPEKPKYANLREIMDYSLPFELIYSGVENDSYYDILYDMGVRNFLMSYHYVQAKHIKFSERFEGRKVRLFIDSGAHTYQNDPKYEEYDVDYWEKHLQGYLRWVEKNRDYIFAIANFDFENIVGAEQVDVWNKKYFEPFMLRTGIPVCFVWHQNSLNDWEYYCKRYPYVGFSSVNTEGESIDLDEYKNKLKIAEKNESLVHGFGMTRTGMLTELPFYTSDSTTWLVGLQYGEMNYWNDTKMSRLKKTAWKGEYLPIICEKYNLDRELLEAENTTEMIKANVGAFIDAENFIQTRLRSRMYWLKKKAKKVDVDNLPEDFFPDPDWFEAYDEDEAKQYAESMNINPELENVADVIYDVTVFLNWNNPKYADLIKDSCYMDEEDSALDDAHDQFVNRIVPDRQAKIDDLIKFYKECVSGERDTLLQLGTNFDRVTKERESYIEDAETELVDMSKEEVKLALAHVLPPAELDEAEKEAEALDSEIYSEAKIVPVFDSKGRFLKGQKQVLKPKQVYSKKYPKFACDTCYAASNCPEYKSGYVCAYDKMFNRFDTRDMGDIIQGMQGIVSHNMARMQRAMVMETLNGTIDDTVTSLMSQNMGYLQLLQKMYENGSSEVLRQTRIMRADGSTEETTQITNPQSGGILEKLFGGMQKDSPPAKEDVIEADSKVIEDEPPKERKRNPRYDDTEEEQ